MLNFLAFKISMKRTLHLSLKLTRYFCSSENKLSNDIRRESFLKLANEAQQLKEELNKIRQEVESKRLKNTTITGILIVATVSAIIVLAHKIN